MFSYKFIHNRRKKLDKEKRALIELYIYKDRTHRKWINTKIKVKSTQWNADKQQIYNHPNKVMLNAKLKAFKHKYEELELQAASRGRWDIDVVNSADFKQFIKENERKSSSTQAVLKLYRKNKIDSFQKMRDSYGPITRDWIDKYTSKTFLAYHQVMRAHLNYAYKEGFISSLPDMNVSVKPNVTISYLTKKELDLVEKFNPDKEIFQFAKDFFLFQCYTGMSFIDVCNLEQSDIIIKENACYVQLSRKKTSELFGVYLLPQARSILKRYKHKEKPFIINYYSLDYRLKKIGRLCGLKKKLRSHIGRHTFATTVALTNGISMETLSYMLGHSDIKTTTIYGKIVNSKMMEDMAKLEHKLSEQG
jgi:integrase